MGRLSSGWEYQHFWGAKGFNVLSSLSPGEGFWLNSLSSETVSISGTAGSGSLSVTAGWNLLGLKGDQTKTITVLISGNESSTVSVWKWENNTWSVYLAGENDGGAAYAQTKGFNELSSIGPGEGFWFNAGGSITLD